MTRKRLGSSDLFLTPLGVGAWAMGGGGWAFAWGPQDDRESVTAIRAAIDAGLNWIDTAAVYGLGHSEEVVGRAIEGLATRPLIFTKCGRNWNAGRQIVKCLKRDDVRTECENSLRRLGVDAIDLYQMHWPEPDEDIEEGWETMVRLRDEGKVRWIGLSNFSVAQMERLRGIAPITSLEPPYSAVSPEIEAEVLPYCRQQGIGVIVYSPMKSGLLTGTMTQARIASLPEDDFRKRAPAFNEPALTRNLALAEVLRAIGARHDRSAGETAIAWTLRRDEVTAAIVGLRSAEQLHGVIGAADYRLTDADIAEIDAFRVDYPL